MESHNTEEQKLLKAKKHVRQLKLFYIHFAGYLVVLALLLYNLYIVEGEYKNNIISLNLSVLVLWTVAILWHALKVFKERKVFKKSWEDKKIASYLEKDHVEETKMWE
ncbi:2TM domain-containing protein [Winogradskyella sp. HB-48]|uniref:2TM domain-containing protein n=1 Tax=Winogradskyella sp. HB-48 TaxID=3416808 RepID=UPI003CF0B937